MSVATKEEIDQFLAGLEDLMNGMQTIRSVQLDAAHAVNIELAAENARLTEERDKWAGMFNAECLKVTKLRTEVEQWNQAGDVLFATIADESLRSAALDQKLEEAQATISEQSEQLRKARLLPDHWRSEASRGFSDVTKGIVNLCSAELEQTLSDQTTTCAWDNIASQDFDGCNGCTNPCVKTDDLAESELSNDEMDDQGEPA